MNRFPQEVGFYELQTIIMCKEVANTIRPGYFREANRIWMQFCGEQLQCVYMVIHSWDDVTLYMLTISKAT